MMKRFEYILVILSVFLAVSCQEDLDTGISAKPGELRLLVDPQLPQMKAAAPAGDIYAYLYGEDENIPVEALRQEKIVDGYYVYILPQTVKSVIFSNVAGSSGDFTLSRLPQGLVFEKKDNSSYSGEDILAACVDLAGLQDGGIVPVVLKRLNARLTLTLAYKDAAGQILDLNSYIDDAVVNAASQARNISISGNVPGVSGELLPSTGFPDSGSTPDPSVPETGSPSYPYERPSNLLQNGGFEGGSLDIDWTVPADIQGIKIIEGTEIPARSGNHLLHFSGQISARVSKTFKVEKNSIYRVSYWLREREGRVGWNDQVISCDFEPQVSYIGLSSDEWKLFYCDYFTGANEEITIYMMNNAWANDFFVDDIALYKVGLVGDNLINDGGMEYSSGNIPEGWHVLNADFMNNFSFSQEKVYSGKRSLKMTPGAEVPLASRPFRQLDNTPLIFQGHAFSTDHYSNFDIIFKSNCIELDSHRHAMYDTVNWRNVWNEARLDVPVVENRRIPLNMEVNIRSGADFYMDDFSVYSTTPVGLIYEEPAPEPVVSAVVPGQLELMVTENGFLMPTASGHENVLELYLKGKSGDFTKLSKTLAYGFEANHHYKLKVTVRMNENKSSLVIEDIVKEDINIEF